MLGMMGDRTMTRRVAAWLLIVVLLAAWPTTGAFAQANPKDTSAVDGGGAGLYVQAAAPSVVGAFDRAMNELDAAPMDASPRQVKDASFRRRLLELRLLMDFNAFAYDKDKLKVYREVVDQSYEAVGVYQDITDIEKELGTSVSPDVVAQRQAEMNEALAQIRNDNMRRQMRQFLAAPLPSVRKGGGPGLWDITGSAPSNSLVRTPRLTNHPIRNSFSAVATTTSVGFHARVGSRRHWCATLSASTN
jgi:hypothetical protein